LRDFTSMGKTTQNLHRYYQLDRENRFFTTL
jgi:hypothetical protein